MLERLRNMLSPAERPQRPLFEAIVASARQPWWYRECAVPDSIEGRFAVLATLTALATLRLEAGSAAARRAAVGLAECFIDEMDGEVRQMGLGDPAIAKQVGAMVGALGSRVGRLRLVVGRQQPWDEAVGPSLYRGASPDGEAAAQASATLQSFWKMLDATDEQALIAGRLAPLEAAR